jgi:hypothetical protein
MTTQTAIDPVHVVFQLSCSDGSLWTDYDCKDSYLSLEGAILNLDTFQRLGDFWTGARPPSPRTPKHDHQGNAIFSEEEF